MSAYDQSNVGGLLQEVQFLPPGMTAEQQHPHIRESIYKFRILFKWNKTPGMTAEHQHPHIRESIYKFRILFKWNNTKCLKWDKLSPVKRICVFEHSVMTNFNCACPAIQRGQGSGFLSEGSSWLTACMSEQRMFWRDCADAQARLNLRCSHRWLVPNSLDAVQLLSVLQDYGWV